MKQKVGLNTGALKNVNSRAFKSAVGFLVATLGFMACVTSNEKQENQKEESLSESTDDELYGDLESGLESPLWTEEEKDSQNVIDKALSQSPYNDFEEAVPSFSESSSTRNEKSLENSAAKSAKPQDAKKSKKAQDKSKKKRQSGVRREIKAASKKEKLR